MLISLAEVEDFGRLAKVLERPATMEDRTLYVTGQPDIARTLIARKLPCIFLEKEAADIFGADMVILQDEAWDWKSDHAFLEEVWKRHYHLPWIIAETPRLLIRETTAEDLSALLEIYAQEAENADVKPFSQEPERELESYIRSRYRLHGYGLWTVIEKKSKRVIGRIGFEECSEKKGGNGEERCGSGVKPDECSGRDAAVPELQYMIRREERGKGYAFEAAQAALGYIRERYGFVRAVMRTSKTNGASLHLARKLGFHRLCTAEAENRVFLEIHLK